LYKFEELNITKGYIEAQIAISDIIGESGSPDEAHKQ
jgi:hypothetical protein